jgi:hypothetical protein
MLLIFLTFTKFDFRKPSEKLGSRDNRFPLDDAISTFDTVAISATWQAPELRRPVHSTWTILCQFQKSGVGFSLGLFARRARVRGAHMDLGPFTHRPTKPERIQGIGLDLDRVISRSHPGITRPN